MKNVIKIGIVVGSILVALSESFCSTLLTGEKQQSRCNFALLAKNMNGEDVLTSSKKLVTVKGDREFELVYLLTKSKKAPSKHTDYWLPEGYTPEYASYFPTLVEYQSTNTVFANFISHISRELLGEESLQSLEEKIIIQSFATAISITNQPSKFLEDGSEEYFKNLGQVLGVNAKVNEIGRPPLSRKYLLDHIYIGQKRVQEVNTKVAEKLLSQDISIKRVYLSGIEGDPTFLTLTLKSSSSSVLEGLLPYTQKIPKQPFAALDTFSTWFESEMNSAFKRLVLDKHPDGLYQ